MHEHIRVHGDLLSLAPLSMGGLSTVEEPPGAHAESPTPSTDPLLGPRLRVNGEMLRLSPMRLAPSATEVGAPVSEARDLAPPAPERPATRVDEGSGEPR